MPRIVPPLLFAPHIHLVIQEAETLFNEILLSKQYKVFLVPHTYFRTGRSQILFSESLRSKKCSTGMYALPLNFVTPLAIEISKHCGGMKVMGVRLSTLHELSVDLDFLL